MCRNYFMVSHIDFHGIGKLDGDLVIYFSIYVVICIFIYVFTWIYVRIVQYVKRQIVCLCFFRMF